MIVDRAKYYAVLRPKFKGLSQQFVTGNNMILDAWEARFAEMTPVPQFAVVLATSYHESGHTMHPIHEYGDRSRFMRLYDVSGSNPTRARKYGNVEVGDGLKFCGKGLVQLTWRVNYRKATKRLRELGIIGADVDFERDPDLVMRFEYAIPIMFYGMEEGWFTGRTLDQIVDPTVSANRADEAADFEKSRTIINGTDAAKLIAGHAMAFLDALMVSVAPGAVTDRGAPIAAPRIERVQPVSKAASVFNQFWIRVAESFGK